MELSESTTDGVFPSTCWECSVCCGSLVTVEGGRVTKVAPNPQHPHSKGAFCVKGIRGAPGITYAPSRVLHPRRRTGPRGSGRWQEISWDEALDEMADRLAEVRAQHGPLAIAGAVSGAFFSRGLVVALLMRSLGSPNWMINQDLCGGCRAVSARATGVPVTGDDVANARTILIAGRNSYAADPVQWAALKQAKQRGARIVVIDPKRIPACDLADLWLRPRPGTDAALALAMMQVMIARGLYDRAFVERWCHGFSELKERVAGYTPALAAQLTGVPADAITAAALMYADGPSTFVSGHGIDAFSAGVQTYRAFHCLVAISGNVDRLGGNRRVKPPRGFSTYLEVLHRPAFRLPREVEEQTIGAAQFPLWAGPKGWQTACHNPSVISAILTGKPYPVRALYVSGVNIAVTYPDTARTKEALRSLDFLAVATHDMTPTAEMADLVLPKTTALEEEEVSFVPGALPWSTPAPRCRRAARRAAISTSRRRWSTAWRSAARSTKISCPGATSARSTRSSWATAAFHSRNCSARATCRCRGGRATPPTRRLPPAPARSSLSPKTCARPGSIPCPPTCRPRARRSRPRFAPTIRSSCSPATARSRITTRASAISRGR
jgi:thiosulfate reductase / polysulfide reductase chain A